MTRLESTPDETVPGAGDASRSVVGNIMRGSLGNLVEAPL